MEENILKEFEAWKIKKYKPENLFFSKKLEKELEFAEIRFAILEKKSLKVFKDFHTRGFKIPDNVCTLAASVGCLDILKYAYSLGYKCDSKTCVAAVSNLSFNKSGICLEILKFIKENYGILDSKACDEAVDLNNFKCFKYLLESGCVIDARTCELAAKTDAIFGIKFLKYIKEEDFHIWNVKICKSAIKTKGINSLEVLKYANKNNWNYDWNSKLCKIASKYENQECLNYLCEF